MSNTIKNIAVILGVLTIVFSGYYFYAQVASDSATDNDAVLQAMLANTAVFIERSQELDAMSFDEGVFQNERFRTLQSFTSPVESQPIGRSNPFAEAGGE
ncbi:MAG: hypothetical protein RL538_343 [Candidatus Parcubacteria bacterium]|jgi:hypothetical protein